MKKLILIAIALLLSGCTITPWHKGMCIQTDPKLIKKANAQCVYTWQKRQGGYRPDPRIALNFVELIKHNCKAKSKYKKCS